MTKRFSIAAAAAFAIGAALFANAAQADQHMTTLTSESWKPGFTRDGNRYVKQVMVETRDDAQVTRIQGSRTSKPGFTYNGAGGYQRIVERDANRTPSLVATVEHRKTWAPGFTHDGSGYARVAYTVNGAASDTMLAANTGGGTAEIAEAR